MHGVNILFECRLQLVYDFARVLATWAKCSGGDQMYARKSSYSSVPEF